MNGLLSMGRLVDVALVVIAIEMVALVVLRHRLGSGLKPVDVIGHLLAGALLLAGVRCAVSGSDPRWTLGFLAASFPAHLFDLVRRARRASPIEVVAHQ